MDTTFQMKKKKNRKRKKKEKKEKRRDLKKFTILEKRRSKTAIKFIELLIA